MTTQFLSATPVLASLDIARSVAFCVEKLGFTAVYQVQGSYGIVENGAVELHFWACQDKKIAEATSCRIQITDIHAYYAHCETLKIVHRNAPLRQQPWGNWEFSVLDVDGNLITFYAATVPQ